VSGAADLVALDALIEELTVDAYGDEEQLVGFLTGAEDALTVGEIATVAGVSADRTSATATSADPREIACSVAADVAVSKAGLSPALLSELRHLASLHNPMFYERQRLRLSTHRTSRLIRCYEEDPTHLHMPRGCSNRSRRPSNTQAAG